MFKNTTPGHVSVFAFGSPQLKNYRKGVSAVVFHGMAAQYYSRSAFCFRCRTNSVVVNNSMGAHGGVLSVGGKTSEMIMLRYWIYCKAVSSSERKDKPSIKFENRGASYIFWLKRLRRHPNKSSAKLTRWGNNKWEVVFPPVQCMVSATAWLMLLSKLVRGTCCSINSRINNFLSKPLPSKLSWARAVTPTKG